MKHYNIEATLSGERLDSYVNSLGLGFSRSYIQKLIKDGSLLVNALASKSSYKVETGDIITFSVPDEEEIEIIAQDIPLDIYYEDEDMLVVNKPKDMVVHPAAGRYTFTLVNALLYHCGNNLSDMNSILRPGIVHRIDKDTTGLLLICKTNTAYVSISAQLRAHSIKRLYKAIVCGIVNEDEGIIDKPIGRHNIDRKKMAVVDDGKEAITHYRVLKRFKNHTYIECQLKTGRTHQIRVHMASIGHPLLGDTVYGHPVKKLQGQTLHASRIGFKHPSFRQYMEFNAPLPEYFNELIKSNKL